MKEKKTVKKIYKKEYCKKHKEHKKEYQKQYYEANKDKIRENRDAEIFDICLGEAKEKGHNLIVIDTTKDIKKLLNSIEKKIQK